MCSHAHEFHACTAAGNPTNIIVGQAIDLSFINFSKWTLLPTLRAHLCSVLPTHCSAPV